MLDRVRHSSTGLGIGALVSSIWIGSSFWGAIDTAFCRIYHVRCRSWVGAEALRAGDARGRAAVHGGHGHAARAAEHPGAAARRTFPSASSTSTPSSTRELRGRLLTLFAILCVIFWTVPNRLVPWRALWPGALGATLAIGVVDITFPLYLTHISTIARLGTSLVFVVIVLIWFYAIAIILLAAAVINAIRFELHDTGELSIRSE